MTSIVSLDEAYAQLNLDPNDDTDAVLVQSYIDAIGAAVESYLDQVVAQRTITEYLDAGTGTLRLALSYRPVISVTSITSTDGLTTWDPSNFVDTGGVFRCVAGQVPVGLVQVVYEAGYVTVPENIKRGALVILQHNWETHRGIGSVMGGVIGPEETHARAGAAFAFPHKALEWLGPQAPALA